MKKQIISFSLVALGFLVGASALSVLAQTTYTPPTSAPPNGNVPAPINTGSMQQNKTGLLGLANLVVNNLNVASGTLAAGNVLTADQFGNAAWAAPAAGSGGSNVTMLSAGVGLPAPSLTSQTVNIGPGASAPYNILPASSTAVMLQGSTQVDTGSCDYAGLYLFAKGSGNARTVSQTSMTFADDCYSGSVGSSAFTIVPVSGSGSTVNLTYYLTGTGNASGPSGSLSVVGYVTGSATTVVPAGDATDVQCSIAQTTIPNNQPISLSMQGVGGSGVYKYQYKLDSGAWTAVTFPNSTASISASTVGSHTVSIDAEAVNGDGTAFTPTPDTWHTSTAGCPTVTVTYPTLNVGSVVCNVSGLTNHTNANANLDTQSEVYTLSGAPTGGEAPYTYQFTDWGNYSVSDVGPVPTAPAGLVADGNLGIAPGGQTMYDGNSPLAATTYTGAAKSLTLYYSNPSFNTSSANGGDTLYVTITSKDGQQASGNGGNATGESANSQANTGNLGYNGVPETNLVCPASTI